MMDALKKHNDCYFYYYSTCTKGDNCVFRHEPAALGCETMCSLWQQGKCVDKHCKLRHMELRKNRKQIPCYWETQPGGCLKKHCPFQHKNAEARLDGIAAQPTNPVQPNAPMLPLEAVEAAPVLLPPEVMWQQQQRQVVLDSSILGVLPQSELLQGRQVLPQDPYVLPVDQLVVNFEEESDNESAPSMTPIKSNTFEKHKSEELMELERIQAESAAFYSYEILPEQPQETVKPKHYSNFSLDDLSGKSSTNDSRHSLDFKILSLDEIRARKKVLNASVHLEMSRKRKSSISEIVDDSCKMIKLVNHKSIVYKKVDANSSTDGTN